ncbi:MAG TPA: hypothetical protein PLV83_04765 [Bacilli bacterium]|nr:hypothetical protein [Bacilli bacterium]
MDQLNVTYEAIDSNESLSDALKDNFKYLIAIFHQNFNEVDLSNFNERIKRLKIKKGNKFIVKDAVEYNSKEDTLYLNEEKLNTVDAKHELMYAILTIITAKDNFYGFDSDGKLKALNVGITEILTNFLVGNESE